MKIISLSHGIFWAVLPSLLFFLVLPFLMKSGMKFGLSMIVSSAVMVTGYSLYAWFLKKLGVSL